VSGTVAISMWISSFLNQELRARVNKVIFEWKFISVSTINLVSVIPAASITAAW